MSQHVYVYQLTSLLEQTGYVSISVNILNDSTKTIKYVHVCLTPINRVGDLVYCRVTGRSTIECQFTGPLYSGEKTCEAWGNIWCSNMIDKFRVDYVDVIYMDGTQERLERPILAPPPKEHRMIKVDNRAKNFATFLSVLSCILAIIGLCTVMTNISWIFLLGSVAVASLGTYLSYKRGGWVACFICMGSFFLSLLLFTLILSLA